MPTSTNEGRQRRSFWVRNFTAFLVSVAIIGGLILYVGSSNDNTPIASLGSAIFSAATVGAIFKVIGYEGVKEMLTNIITNYGFLKRLCDEELRQHIKKAIAQMKEVAPSEVIYDAFERNFIDELATIVAYNRSFNIVISPARSYGRSILASTTTYSATLTNESPRTLPLFPDYISKGTTTIPRTMPPRNIPEDPYAICNVSNIRVNGRRPVLDREEIDWVDRSDKTKGVYHLLQSSLQIQPRASISVTYTVRSLIDDSDFVIRRFLSFTKDVSLTIQHPRGFEVKVIWFCTPDVNLLDPVIEPTSYTQRANGVFFPGGGFIAVLKRRRS